MFTSEQIDLDLFSWISVYFFCCYSLLNLCLQNGYKFESAWWSPQQFKHLKEWRHGSPFFVSSLGGLILALALQHHPNSRWFLDLWGPLHLTYLDPWILHENITWPHFQQFLHCGMPRFMLALLMVVIYWPTLKHLLISILALLPLWTFQISIQMIDMSNLGNTLITLGLDAKDMLLKIWFCLRIDSISLEVRCSWEFACR